MLRNLMMVMKKAGSGFTYATWNASDKTASLALSGGDLMATSSASSQGVRSTLSKSSGKWYWEYLVSTSVANISLGIGYSTSTLSNQLGNGNDGAGYINGSGDMSYNFSLITTGATYTTGDVIGIALDATANTVSFYKNNALQGTVTGLAAGSRFAQIYTGTTNGGVITANFGATALTYTPPSGFNAGLYV